jgi:molybdopterin molybdotransferase
MSQKNLSELSKIQHACDDYDPNSMLVDQAKAYIGQFLHPVSETELVELKLALDRVTAQPVVSPFNVPDFDNSAMDGYAYRHQDTTADELTTLDVLGTAMAGSAYSEALQPKSCIRIMTGAVIPQGADTVIPQELVSVQDGKISFNRVLPKGANVRRAGEDIVKRALVFPVGHHLQPADIGLLASLGIAEISVYRKLKVAFFSTGDELLDIRQPLQTGKIYDSNRYTLFAMLQKMNVQISDLGSIPDQPARLEATLLEAAKQHDVVITSGGVSVGEADFMKQLLTQHGQVLFWKIAMKPGRPLAYGKIGAAHYFGLPGNPVAVMVTFYQFVKQALETLMGKSVASTLPMLNVRLADAVKKAKGRKEFQRGILFLDENGQWVVGTTGNQSSGVLSSMSKANCFIVLDEDCGSVEAGEWVKVQLFQGIC